MKRLLLVGPAGHHRSELRDYLQAAGYEVVEGAGSRTPEGEADGPDLVLLDHEADAAARQAIRSELGTDHSRGVPVVEMCLSRPDLFPAAAQVLDRVSGPTGARRHRNHD